MGLSELSVAGGSLFYIFVTSCHILSHDCLIVIDALDAAELAELFGEAQLCSVLWGRPAGNLLVTRLSYVVHWQFFL